MPIPKPIIDRALIGYIAFLTSVITVGGGVFVKLSYGYLENINTKLDTVVEWKQTHDKDDAIQAASQKIWNIGVEGQLVELKQKHR